jgi:hypothetical protein
MLPSVPRPSDAPRASRASRSHSGTSVHPCFQAIRGRGAERIAGGLRHRHGALAQGRDRARHLGLVLRHRRHLHALRAVATCAVRVALGGRPRIQPPDDSAGAR